MTNKRRRKRTPNDGLGEVFEDGDYLDGGSFMFLDGNSGEFEKGVKLAKTSVHDGFGNVAGHRPGFAFSGPPLVADENLQEAATLAYEERNKALSRGLRGCYDPVHTGNKNPGTVPNSVPHPTQPKEADALARKANEAYVQKVERLRNAYKEKTP